MNNNYLVIMAGGIGSRFWPMSTPETPKQFLDILGTGQTMIQQTINRLHGIVPIENVYIVTGKRYKALIKEQLPEIKDEQILMEPCMRNTAPCIAYAVYKINQQNPDANIVVAPSDHLITKEEAFRKVIQDGLDFVSTNDVLLTLGIHPHRPETGYGYIQAGASVNDVINTVQAFKEKPNLATAENYLSEGNFFWNAGIFLWSSKSILNAFESYLPELAKIFKAGETVYYTNGEQAFVDSQFPQCENISIDYGIMEHANNIYVMPADFGWSDLGTWGSLWEKREKDEAGNTVVGDAVKTYDCENNIITIPDGRKVVLQGLKDCIVTEANGVFMVCQKKEEQRIKEFQKES
ncbi:mannose-1-phosphate guanylyltransferase [Carboxylicivirga sp. M1479]|uniref:mannose-1-phosphate guanylyltransferase n=1 Tax=Carboxylicivirga sp. M1479 TaxID=2594476 RepID=UPI00117786A0|nr:mannose-1-phosphate guanylyltransferase [Carboxylicivirga sp. M1479]TRX72016.1 mannose-1-phosphate guanylyltransferase [Carboxylicivirga sp. M1479]